MKTPLYPIALNLKGVRVLIVGGGSIAARKLSEILICEAQVTLIATETNELIKRYAPPVQLIERPYQKGDEKGYALVFACTDSEKVNGEIATACVEQGIWCNRADASELSAFHVPGVIRRGDVTIAMGTAGAAPGLTRLLKQKLNTALGEEITVLASALAEFRKSLRASKQAEIARQIMESLPYSQLLEVARQQGESGIKQFLSNWLLPQTKNKADKPLLPVALVGAGPGHPGLLTLLAVESLKSADVILHDRLIAPEILDYARPDCEIIPVEKRGHHASMRQEHINALLVEKAKQGLRVVRLKGGDPFVFGRGFEEIQALEAAALNWSVIPGVSSATGAPSFAGLPLTHRGGARSFAVMTGMAFSEANHDIPKADTVVVLMGLHHWPSIAEAFIKQGWSANTPAAALEQGTRPDQRMCRATLSTLGDATARLGFASPVLMVVGVCAGLSAAGGPR